MMTNGINSIADQAKSSTVDAWGSFLRSHSPALSICFDIQMHSNATIFFLPLSPSPSPPLVVSLCSPVLSPPRKMHLIQSDCSCVSAICFVPDLNKNCLSRQSQLQAKGAFCLSLSRCLFVRLILSPLTIHSTFGDHMHTGHHTWCLPLTHVSLFLPLFTLPLSLTRNNKLAVQKFNHTHRLHVRIQVTFYCTEQISIQKVRGVPKYTQVYLEYFPSLSPSLSSLFMMLIKLSLHNLTYTSSSPFSSLPLHSFIALLVFMALSFTPSLPAKHVIYTTYINPMATAK